MWRHQLFPEIDESDQSISDGDDEEQEHFECPENYVSLAGTSDPKKEDPGVASRLESLKGFHQKDVGFSSEDEVEVPDFHMRNLGSMNVGCEPFRPNTDGCIRISDEWISGVEKGVKLLAESIPGEQSNVSEDCDLHTKKNEMLFEPGSSFTVHKELERLNHSAENARRPMVFLEVKIPGSKCKTNQRSSFRLMHKQGVSNSVGKDMEAKLASDDELLDEDEADAEAEASEFWPVEKSSPVLLGGLVLPKDPAVQQDHNKRSMAEILDNLPGKIRNSCFKSKKRAYMLQGRRRKGLVQRPVIKSTSSSGKMSKSDEDPCELMDGESSTDSEDNARNAEIAIINLGRKTMADKLHEAFGSASTNNRIPSFVVPKQSSIALFGRLQNMMQEQKEQDAEFLKNVQTEVWPKDEAECISVKILSRSFDAKLNVCQCSLIESEESSLHNSEQESFGKIWTVIFSTRVCGDVDLEVGNLIRISPPWKEVQVLRGGEIIILASYFSLS